MTGGFDSEVEHLRALGVPGRSGRLRDLFDYLAERGHAAGSATQADIARGVFGQDDAESDDATVRVYVHRLRKRLDEFYEREDERDGAARLEIPSGTYALRLVGEAAPERPSSTLAPSGSRRWPLVAGALALIALAVATGWLLARADGPQANAIWEPLADSDRPVLLVLGDYYMFGEIDPVRPEEGRLIRDFRVDSAADLLAMQEADPVRYGNAEDVGLTYLPVSSAGALTAIAPVLARDGKRVEVIESSHLEPSMLTRYDVVYVGLFSGLGLLEEPVMQGSGFAIGESYDEIVDTVGNRIYTSEEARSLATPAFYRDYALLTRLRGPGGGWMTVLAGSRDTGLRGLAAIAASPELDEALENAAASPAFEALYQVTGQQGADLSERLIAARSR